MSQIFMIAGPNGAGKTTLAMDLLPDLLHCIDGLYTIILKISHS